jgi:hypothetical protein
MYVRAIVDIHIVREDLNIRLTVFIFNIVVINEIDSICK